MTSGDPFGQLLGLSRPDIGQLFSSSFIKSKLLSPMIDIFKATSLCGPHLEQKVPLQVKV